MPKKNQVVKFKKLHPDAVIPEKATSGSAGFDLCTVEDFVIPSMSRVKVRTGLAIEIPSGYEGQVRPRSGLAARQGITVLNSPGTVDSDYRGEVQVILINFGPEASFKSGDRIAQMVIGSVPSLSFEEVSDISDTERGEGGFGSTGI